MKTFNIKKIVISVVIALAVLVVGASSLHAVPAGHTGVVTRFGAVDDTVLSEGLHVVIPFVTRVVDMNNQVTKAEVVSASASKDLQTVNSTVALNYRIESLSAASVYQNIGVNYENVVVIPAIQEAVKSVMAQYTAEELITLRQTVGAEIQEEISSKLTPYGFSTQSVNIVDFQFSEEFNAAIEAKQTAQQNALKAEQDLARVKVEAEQKIAEAQAEAESYRLKSQEITDQMLKMEFIDKWDGKLPVVVSDGQSLFNIDSILDSAASSAGSTSDSASSTTE
ncbi:MAG: prohibitin family protein [Hydrogeniiclostridium sp.]